MQGKVIHICGYTFYRETEEPVVENEKNIDTEKQPGEEDVVDANKDSPANEPEEKEPEDKVHRLF